MSENIKKALKKRPNQKPRLTPQRIDKIAELYARGLDTRTIADLAGIGQSTLYDWINRYPELREAIEERKSGSINMLMGKMEELADAKNIGAVKYLLARNRSEYSEKQQINVTAENYNYNYKVKDPNGKVIDGINWGSVLLPEGKSSDHEELEE